MRSLRKIIDTNHALERFLQRYFKVFSRSEVNKVIYDGMEKIMEDFDDEKAVYVVYSKSTGICVIIDWRPDSKEDSNRNHAIIVTLPPPKNSFSDFKTMKRDDVKIMVENFLLRKVPPKILKESTEYIKEIKFNGLSIFFEDEEVYDYGVDHYILLEEE